MPDKIISECVREIPFPRPEIWRVLARTDWLNRSLGLPPVEYDLKPLPEGGSLIHGRAALFGCELHWREFPFEWMENEFYRVQRVFKTGPLKEAILGMDFIDLGQNRTRVRAWSELTPRGVTGTVIARLVIAPKATRDMSGILEHVINHLSGKEQVVLPKLPRAMVMEQPLQAGLVKLAQTGAPEPLIRRLETLLKESTEVEISRIRPFAVARVWGCDRWEVLRLFLQATRSGLLNLSWEVLCPNCRSTRQPLVTHLSELRHAVHCDVCQIKYDGELDKSVELKFVIHQSLRAGEMQTFCLAGPGGKPHVVSQMYLQPGEQRVWDLSRLEGEFRLRSPQVKETVTMGGEGVVKGTEVRELVCAPDHFAGWPVDQRVMGQALQMRNPLTHAVEIALERTGWDPDILTAAVATNWQEFRDLFAREVISPLEQVTIGQQIILFTDLKGSTAMYCGIGDTSAYVLVRDHFMVLYEAIRNNHGGIVKTIGDAVMAVFSRVDEALLAVRQMHEGLSRSRPKISNAPPLLLKSALHLGPCLAVNANDKLDYFGTAVNLAARLVDRSQGGDLVVSDEFYQRVETQEFLRSSSRMAEVSEVTFRGFNEPQKVWRVPIL